jgi:glycosyltransferase involved in cell wall biosynthesis
MLEAYQKSDHSPVEFVVVSLVKEKGNSRIEEFKWIGIRVVTLEYNNWRKALINSKRVRSMLVNENPDVCHSTGFIPDLILKGLTEKRIKRASSIFNYPYEDFPMEYGWLAGRIMAYLQIKAVRSFNSAITCSYFIADKLSKCRFPLDVIYTGVPDDFFVPLSNKGIILMKKELGLPLDKTILIYIARFIPRKNARFLVEAFKEANNKDLYLLMMGDGEDMEHCKHILDDENSIRYLGTCPSTLEYLQVSDYYISPSFSEGFPTSVLEALSVGVQPMLSDIAPHREMIGGICPDRLFPLENNAVLVEMLKSLGSNNKSSELRIFLQNHYSASIMAKKYVELYMRIAK